MKIAGTAGARERRLRRSVVVPLRCSKPVGGGGFRLLGSLEHGIRSSESLHGLFVSWRSDGGLWCDVFLKVGRHDSRRLLALTQREQRLLASS